VAIADRPPRTGITPIGEFPLVELTSVFELGRRPSEDTEFPGVAQM
jgi:hypothetical protein